VILGVVLAGGKSSRFGSDKALAEVGGRTLIARAVDQLAGLCEDVVVAGRAEAPTRTIPDWPGPDHGPLGGIAAALNLAADMDFEVVLSSGVDSLGLPDDLLERLRPAPAYIEQQPVVGLWPASAAATLKILLEGDGRHSMLAFAEAIGARAVKLDTKPANINTPADLAAAERRHGI